MGANNKDLVGDVMNLLKGVEKASQAVDNISAIAASNVRPPQDLIDPWEPHFEPDVTAMSVTGSRLTLAEIEDAFIDHENLHFVGPTGAGKTTIARAIMDRQNETVRKENREIAKRNEEAIKKGAEVGDLEKYKPLPFWMSHYSCHGASRSEDVIGSVSLRYNEEGKREVVETEGALVRAWEHGGAFILEEVDYAPASMLGEMNLFLDGSSKEATIYLNGPRKIFKHDDFRCIATSNTHGRGENAVEYADTKQMNAAFLNRFNYTVLVTWLTEAAEARVIRSKTGLYGENAEHMIKVANKSRKAYEAGTLETAISTRNLLAWARECRRSVKRFGNISSWSTAEIWNKIVMPASVPTIINRLSNDVEREAMHDMINIM